MRNSPQCLELGKLFRNSTAPGHGHLRKLPRKICRKVRSGAKVERIWPVSIFLGVRIQKYNNIQYVYCIYIYTYHTIPDITLHCIALHYITSPYIYILLYIYVLYYIYSIILHICIIILYIQYYIIYIFGLYKSDLIVCHLPLIIHRPCHCMALANLLSSQTVHHHLPALPMEGVETDLSCYPTMSENGGRMGA